MGIGAGITYDSVAEEEWDETLLKGKFLTNRQPEFYLFETLLWQRNFGYYLLEEHMQRLLEAARFFQFSCHAAAVRAQLRRAEEDFPAECCRVRLMLEKDGRITVGVVGSEVPLATSLPVIPEKAAPGTLPEVDFSPERTDTRTAWVFYKTSRRELYNREYARAQAEGFYEMLFLNEVGGVTEGCISNLVIYHRNRYLTPPVSSGLLPGIMRGRLLADTSPPVFEEELSEQDVRDALAVYVCNSVRGIVRVALRR
jgi:para-aminobenzoate synthetase/4-amino-4-deoxychorismate lyase